MGKPMKDKIRLLAIQVACMLGTEIKGIDFKETKMSWYRPKTKRITISIGALYWCRKSIDDGRLDIWMKWLVIHEVCHCIDMRHSAIFKKVEEEICRLFGIVIIERKKSYPRKVYCQREKREFADFQEY